MAATQQAAAIRTSLQCRSFELTTAPVITTHHDELDGLPVVWLSEPG